MVSQIKKTRDTNRFKTGLLAEKGGKDIKQFGELIKNVTMLAQFGLSFITPTLICIGICWWLTDRFQIGGWIYILGFFFGMGGSGTFAYRFYLSTVKRQKKETKKKGIAFNRHE